MNKKLLNKLIMITFVLIHLLMISADVAVAVWTEMESGTTEHLKGIWGSSATDVFAVGKDGIILHYDGSNWSDISSGKGLWDVWGSSNTDVFAVGEYGTILHYDSDTDSDGILDNDDNCPETPNGPDLGLCAQTQCGVYRYSLKECRSDTECVERWGLCWTCLMNQEDNYPEGGNRIGDACEWCYADLDSSGDVYPDDAMILLEEWKRKNCSGENHCQADIDGDGKVYPGDAMILLSEWKRKDCPVLP